jgi:hypothetical protein
MKPGQSSNYAVGYGDPHFTVRGNDQFPVCFDFHGYGGDIYTLFYEAGINLVVNAQFDGTARHSWMSQIGIRTALGNELLVTPEAIATQRYGRTTATYAYDHERRRVFDDIVIDFKKDSHGKHLAFVDIENGPVFQIRVNKDHLGFNMVETHEFNAASGIVGTLTRPGGYSVVDDQLVIHAITPEAAQTFDFHIPTEVENKCLKVASKHLGLLYQTDTTNFLVKSIFALPEGFSPKLLAKTDPK